MNLLSVEQLKKTYGEKVLLDGISFGIEEGERIGLIGVNGTGKSTLLKLLAGVDEAESGSITRGNRVVVHYLPQDPIYDPSATVLAQVFQGDAPVMQQLRDYEAVLHRLGQDQNAEEAAKDQAKLIRLQAQLDELNAWQLEHEAKAILTNLGVTDFQARIGTLSGGGRKRVALATALIQPSDVLILDEPTNHIDNESVQWLENYLQRRKGALFMVTHDRYFLDRVVNQIFELDGGQLYRYPGTYHTFIETKLTREAQQRSTEEKRQNFLRSELTWIQRGPRARGTKQKARTDRYYDLLDQAPDAAPEALQLAAATSRLGKSVIELVHVTKTYDTKILFQGFEYIVLRDDRIGIVGPNGAGKSTLLKLMAGRMEPDSGEVIIGSTVNIGYFAQEHHAMDGQVRVIDFIRDTAEYVETADGEHITASQMLERFLFPGSLQWTPISKLSGGEKRRLALLKMLMLAPNVLLLDEPTNDLDIPTLAVLESYLDDFAGAVIVVSHDRYFLDRVVDKVFAFEGDGQISKHPGNFSAYMERRTDAIMVQEATPKSPLTARSAEPTKRTTLKFTYKEQKEYDEIDNKIAKTEQTLQRLAAQMEQSSGDIGKLQSLFAEQQSLETELEGLIERWTYLNERAEEIAQSRES